LHAFLLLYKTGSLVDEQCNGGTTTTPTGTTTTPTGTTNTGTNTGTTTTTPTGTIGSTGSGTGRQETTTQTQKQVTKESGHDHRGHPLDGGWLRPPVEDDRDRQVLFFIILFLDETCRRTRKSPEGL
jgi:hypothetical protein